MKIVEHFTIQSKIFRDVKMVKMKKKKINMQKMIKMVKNWLKMRLSAKYMETQERLNFLAPPRSNLRRRKYKNTPGREYKYRSQYGPILWQHESCSSERFESSCIHTV